MNKEELVKLLNACISLEIVDDKNKLQDEIEILEKIKSNILELKKLNLDKLKECCQINDDEIQELSFYILICELQSKEYQLTNEQIHKVQELLDKYLKEIKNKLVLIEKSQEENIQLKQIIDKISCDKFILNSEELLRINRILKENKIEIFKINQIMVMLSVMIIQELENQLQNNTNDNIEKENNEKQEVVEVPKLSKNNIITKDEYINKFDDLWNKYMNKYNPDKMWKIRGKLVNDIENLMKLTTLEDIEYILKIISSTNINLNEKIIVEMIYHSSKEVIEKIMKITSKLSGNDEMWCFSYLFNHVSIFIKDGDNSSYQDFMKNMYMLDELGITPEHFALIDIETLCISHNRLKRNVLMLEKYQVPRDCYLKSITVLKSTKNLSDELDMWIELGNSESLSYLHNRLAVLVNNIIDKNFKTKFRILRDLDINITINDNYKSIRRDLFKDLDFISENGVVTINGGRYIVTYVPFEVNNSKYDGLMNKRMIEFQEDNASKNEIYQKFVNNTECVRNLYYNVPGVGKVSKNKVYRVFNNLLNNGENNYRNMLIYAITYKSAITEEEYNSACNYVDQLLGNTLVPKGSVK